LTQPAGTDDGGIIVDRVSKSFGSLRALDDVSLHVTPGGILAVLGQNGAGKSTLLRILGTTVLADRGSASVGGVDIVADPLRARGRMGTVLGDERSFYWRLTGRHNLEFFATLQGFDSEEARDRTSELLDRVGLMGAADRRFGEYSSGMKARLSFARALLTEPPVLLLDEPTRTLDPIVARDFRELVVERARTSGSAVLFSTHDLHEASEIADQVVVLERGGIAATTPRGLSARELEDIVIDVTGGSPA
jgi:ABC-2 type transport system ATP-binding protein